MSNKEEKRKERGRETRESERKEEYFGYLKRNGEGHQSKSQTEEKLHSRQTHNKNEREKDRRWHRLSLAAKRKPTDKSVGVFSP